MALAESDIQYLQKAIARGSGNVIREHQSYLLEARLTPVAQAAGLDDVHALVAELQRSADRKLQEAVVEAMTINETSFFRDMQPFTALQEQVLPELIDRRKTRRQLSVWSAASSSGQEAYSIAMLIRSRFPELADWRVSILATDLSEEMVKRTREGVYSQFEVNRGLPASMLVKFFERQGLNWQARPELRQMIHAEKMNLAENWRTPARHDIVFIRNVLIYFDVPMKETILRRVHQSMQPDGYLFLGGGETLLQLDVPFERAAVGNAVCFRPTS